MGIPTNEEILHILILLDYQTADSLECPNIDFKGWTGPKSDMRTATRYAACLANSDGGVIVFGVSNNVIGRQNAIHGAEGYDLDVWRKGIFDNTRPHITVDVEELSVPEGTHHLLIVHIPKGNAPLYGTAWGEFSRRVGKNCMPIDPAEFASLRSSTGAVDWSGEPAQSVTLEDLDPLEIARARNFLRSRNPESELLKLSDDAFLRGLGAVRNDVVTNTGLLLFGKPEVIVERCPQNQVHYVHQISGTNVARNDLWNMGLLQIIEKLEGIFSGPVNPEEELPVGLFRLRISAFPLEVVREVILNAVTHRDYTNPGEVLIRHSQHELTVTSPGGFIGGISLDNILRHEPVARNRTLADAFVKLRLVESAGTGRQRIFTTMLRYGKRIPRYAADGNHVTLSVFDGTFDHSMARLIAQWQAKGRDIGMDELIILTYLKDHRYITSAEAAKMLQMYHDDAVGVMDGMSHPKRGILERKGHARTATYYLTKSVAKDLIGKVAYSSAKGIDHARYQELVLEFVQDHGSITNSECRQLLGLGDSPSSKVEVSRYLRKWSYPDGFLTPTGVTSQRRYVLKKA
jgi:ATP-dependent DNA helicase RecG